MSLSNRAVPKYYGEFREKVLRGEIPVNQEVSMEMNRIDALIADPTIYYDPEPVEKWIEFCEQELTLTDGSDWHMLDTFALWGEEVWGWYYFVERSVFKPHISGNGGYYVRRKVKLRLTKKQYLIVARGAAKTMYLEANQAYGLICDRSTTYQITTAPTMRQGEEVLMPFRTAITRAKGPLFQFLTEGSLQNTTGSRANRQKLCSTKKGIENFMTNSLLEVRPMTIDKLQGLRCRYATADEWLSCDIREDPIGAIEQSASKLDNYLIIAASSEGTIRNGPGDTIKMELLSILKGEYNAPHVSIWWYKLDDLSEVANPASWIKANPNIGKTVTYEVYQEDVERSEHNPSARNDILAKRFGIPMEGYTYFFTYEETKVHRKRNFWGMRCAMGIDLSQGDDFCAFTFLFPLPRECFGVKTRCYISSLTYRRLPKAMRDKYDEFIKEGTLIVLDCSTLDMMEVYDDLDQFITQSSYDVCAVGYDVYNSQEFMQRWTLEYGEFGVQKVAQGSRTESVPLGELKKLAECRQLFFDQKIMQFTMGNAMTITDNNGNRKLVKLRYANKIDSVSALMDAWVVYKVNKENFE